MPKHTDPFDEAVPDDDALPWPDEPPAAPPVDAFDEVDDDEGSDDLAATERPPGTAMPEVHDDADGDDPFDVPVPPGELDEPQRVHAGLPIVPWRTTARVDGLEVPVILSPSMPTSTWRGAPHDAADKPHTVQLGDITVQLVLDVRPGAPLLVLGRDALEGRVLIEV